MIVLDNIVFSLQRTGGISVVWQQHLQRMEADAAWQKRIIEYANTNVQRGEIALKDVETLPLRRLERYRQPAIQVSKGDIFHSSYFRILDGARNVTTVHDLTYHYYRRGLAKAVHLWEEERALHASERIICISEHTRGDLLTCYPWLDEKRVSVVPNGVSETYRILGEKENITPFAAGEYLLYIGSRSVRYKRFEVAVAVARETGQPLVLVGAGVDKREQEWLDEQLGAGHWHSISATTEGEINKLYNGALALLYPSDYEGFGLPILEAQRAGCIVIAQRASSIPEVAGAGAILFGAEGLAPQMAEAVRALKSGRIDREELIEKGLQNASQYSWDKTYKNTIDIYRQLQ